MKVRRNITSIPKRSAAQTWKVILELITGSGSVDSETLHAASSVMEAIIADEQPSTRPIVLKGVGSRLVIYCVYGEDAMDSDLDVDKLNWNPTAGNWSMTAPADTDDIDWMNKTLKDRAPRLTVSDVNADDDESSTASQALKIDWGAIG